MKALENRVSLGKHLPELAQALHTWKMKSGWERRVWGTIQEVASDTGKERRPEGPDKARSTLCISMAHLLQVLAVGHSLIPKL